MFVGQEKLINKINSLTLDSFPSTSVLYGDFGCGKKLLVKYISDKLGLRILDITEKLTQETIEEIYEKPEVCIYLIDSNKITVKQQNMILKFLEEPLKNSFIFILCENKSKLINTVWNRCYKWEFEQYKREDLVQFIDEEHKSKMNYILSIASTPGQVKLIQTYDIENMIMLADKMFEKMSTASFPNTLTISDKVAFKDEKDKIDIRVFIKVLNHLILDKIRRSSEDRYLRIYHIVSDFYVKSKVANVDLKYLFDSFLTKMWKASRVQG